MIVETGLGVQGDGGIAMSKCLLTTVPSVLLQLDQGVLRAEMRRPRATPQARCPADSGCSRTATGGKELRPFGPMGM
jgi:hypothetical protein